jgi:hypothetical protein
MTKRQEFSKPTKLAAFERAKGFCECCFLRIVGTPEYDHVIPAAVGGSADISNCEVLCRKCHRRKTSEKDVPEISKSARIAEKQMGLRRTKRPFVRRVDPWGKGHDR